MSKRSVEEHVAAIKSSVDTMLRDNSELPVSDVSTALDSLIGYIGEKVEELLARDDADDEE